jgi:hypothetical protein
LVHLIWALLVELLERRALVMLLLVSPVDEVRTAHLGGDLDAIDAPSWRVAWS